MKPSLASAQKSPGFVGRELTAIVGNLCFSDKAQRAQRVTMSLALTPTGQSPFGESPENTEINVSKGQTAEKAHSAKKAIMTIAYSTIALVQELTQLSQSPARQI